MATEAGVKPCGKSGVLTGEAAAIRGLAEIGFRKRMWEGAWR